jgi:hypothetical protein
LTTVATAISGGAFTISQNTLCAEASSVNLLVTHNLGNVSNYTANNISGNFLQCTGITGSGCFAVADAINNATGTPTFTAGTNVTSCGCASGYSCTNTRGSLTIVGGTATTGTICTVNFSTTLTQTPGFAQVTQNGGASLYDVGHGIPSTTGVTITSGVTVVGATLTVDYVLLP